TSTPAAPAPAAAPGGERKILYYRNPMGLPDTSPAHCQVNLWRANCVEADARSRSRGRIPPLFRRLGPEDPERRARDEMALEIEGVVDGGVHAEKPLGGASRLEPLHSALSPSHRLMRVFGSVVFAQPLLIRAGQS